MFYKFNSMIGRLSPTSQFSAYNPTGLHPLKSTGPSSIEYDSKATKMAKPHAPYKGGGSASASTVAAASPTGDALGNMPKSSKYTKLSAKQVLIANLDILEHKKLYMLKGMDRPVFFIGSLLTIAAAGSSVYSVLSKFE